MRIKLNSPGLEPMIWNLEGLRGHQLDKRGDRVTKYHRLLLQVIGYRRKRGAHKQMSYTQVLKKIGRQSVEATVRRRRLLFEGAVARQPEGRIRAGEARSRTG